MRMTDEIEVVPLYVVEAKRARRKQVVLARQKGVGWRVIGVRIMDEKSLFEKLPR